MACTVARLPLPPELVAVERLAVRSGNGGSIGDALRFGTYAIHDVHRASAREREEDILPWPVRGSVWDRFAFALRGGGDELLHARCIVTAETRAVPIGGVSLVKAGPTALQCVLTAATDRSLQWELEAEAKGEAPLSGVLTREGESYAVTGTNALAGGGHLGFGTSGYYVGLDGRTLAAVDLLNGGGVYLAADLDATPRMLVAGVAGALLLLGNPAEAADSLATSDTGR